MRGWGGSGSVGVVVVLLGMKLHKRGSMSELDGPSDLVKGLSTG